MTNSKISLFALKETAVDICILDWQIIRFGSPVTDLLCFLFTTTDKTFRDKEYDSLIGLYYESLSKTIKHLGSDPEKLFPLLHLKSELKRCGNFALLMAPMAIQVAQADSSEIQKMDEMFDIAAKGETSVQLVTELNVERQTKCDRILNELLEDIVNRGYYHKIV